MKILFVTWDGPQVSYLTGLFLPIFSRLAEHGFKFHVLQFTWGDLEKINKTKSICNSAGVGYDFVIVKRRPVSLGGFLTAVLGARTIRNLIKSQKIDAVMPRSTLPAMSVLLGLKGTKIPMIFDADGLPLDERVDFGGKSASDFSYRFLRDIEAQSVRRATAVLTRTHKSVDILLARAGAGTSIKKFHVVGNGRDAVLFAPRAVADNEALRLKLGVSIDAPLIVYAGSIGLQYCVKEMFILFDKIHDERSDARFLILTGSPDLIPDYLKDFPHLNASISVKSVIAADVPNYLSCADLGLALRRDSFSMKGVAPIKVGEYLLCGLPVVATRDIGFTGGFDESFSFLVDEMSSSQLSLAANWFLSKIIPQRLPVKSKSRQIGESAFSLDSTVVRYLTALSHLQGKVA